MEHDGELLSGSFHHFLNGRVYVETGAQRLLSIPIDDLDSTDRAYVQLQTERIARLNSLTVDPPGRSENRSSADAGQNHALLAAAFFLAVVLVGLMRRFRPRPGTALLMVAGALGLAAYGGGRHRALQSITDPLEVDSAFAPFKPAINTFWDNDYFHVESNGIPGHPMMAGITNWQQQVPIPQCYTGPNAWSIPLNPVLASTPVPVSPQHFTRGAIALAVNGVPIFNPFTNTGVDAYLDGQLDEFGGHCGRADDYHYHVAPLALYGQTSPTLPIAYALDGFAVYGATEPEGTPMAPLDPNHGHMGANGVYHYHGTTTAPYMIGNMVGQVTEDATMQIIPQAYATPVRPFQSPLPGAVVTGCIGLAGGNGYSVTYTINGQHDSIVYDWTTAGVFTFRQFTGGSPVMTSYNAQPPCVAITTVAPGEAQHGGWVVYPNPATSWLIVRPDAPSSDPVGGNVSLFDTQGHRVFHGARKSDELDVRHLSPGTYFLRVQSGPSEWSTRVVLR